MKRLLCIGVLTIFLCSCGGDAEQQATDIQAPPLVGTNTPPIKTDNARSGNSESASTKPQPPKNDPVENPNTSTSDKGVDRSEESVKPDVREPIGNNDTSGDSGSEDVAPPSENAAASSGGKPKAAGMFAAFPTSSGTVGLGKGDLIPEISGTDIEGVEFKLSDYKGKVIMLDFWGDW